MKTIYKIGEIELILEQISCIDKMSGYLSNVKHIPIWLTGGSEKIIIEICAEGDERQPYQSDPHKHSFVVRAEKIYEDFKLAWHKSISESNISEKIYGNIQ